jgi:hypothetical protein
MSDQPKPDLLVPLTPANEDGEQLAVRKDSEGNIQLGTIGPVRAGQPIPDHAEIIDITHREGHVYEVTKAGPAKVNSKAYRNNWEGIFGKKTDNLLN